MEAYYDAISASTSKGDSCPFIDFMLGEILKTLKAHQGTEQTDYNHKESPLDRQFDITFGREFGVKFGDNEKLLLLSLNSNPGMTAQDLADSLGITKRAVEKQLKKLRELNILSRQGSAKNGLWVINRQIKGSTDFVRG